MTVQRPPRRARASASTPAPARTGGPAARPSTRDARAAPQRPPDTRPAAQVPDTARGAGTGGGRARARAAGRGSMAPAEPLSVQLRGEFITLDALLKVAGVADSGGAAKSMVAAGHVSVDGAPESRKTAKIRPGQRVEVGGITIIALAAAQPDA